MSSLILQQFSERIVDYYKVLQKQKDPEVLNKPQEYLGHRYKEVLDFWNKIENMSEEQLRVVNERDWALFYENRSEWDKAINLARKASKEVVSFDYVYHASLAALDVTKSCAACHATREIIGGVKNPTFLLMFNEKPNLFQRLIRWLKK